MISSRLDLFTFRDPARNAENRWLPSLFSCLILQSPNVKNVLKHWSKDMSRIGYARVSSYGQSLEVQREKLKDCDRVFQEKQSARTDDREQLQLCLDYIRDGDSLVVTKLDRLARSTRDLLNIMNRLEQKHVKLVVLDQQIDTSTPTGMLLFTMLGAIATFENDLRKDRQMQGIELAKRMGIKFGRKTSLTSDQIEILQNKRADGTKISDLMTEFKISKATAYRLLKSAG
jgi:DNA invertase Pin-like site-specific DNA recombinase